MTRFIPLLALLVGLAAGAPAARADDLPMQLPGLATAASVRADADTWIVGAYAGAPSARIARRFGAEHIGLEQTGGYQVARGKAVAFAHALKRKGLLVYAQPNVLMKLKTIPDDPLSGPPNNWRAKVTAGAPDPPPVTPTSPLIALVDAAADLTHPEWTGDPNIATIPGTPVTNEHGTATAAVASAPANGIGILGVRPGARTLNVPLKTVPGTDGEITCRASADAIAQAIQAGAAVINMSYGSVSLCEPEKVQIHYGVAKGIIPVAAAGNEFQQGNPLEFPASLPHVVTVAATDPNDQSAAFSNASTRVDLSAPGVGILTAVPPALDTDGTPDGYQALSGTSFAAPMVSAAMAWVRAARPDLEADRVINAVRLSAHDVNNGSDGTRAGWDQATGFGVLDVAAALSIDASKLPIHDPLEPNDNLSWVDGRAFGNVPAPAIWDSLNPAPVRVSALLDREEDPVDVYRIVVRAHNSVTLSTIPRSGDVDLGLWKTAPLASLTLTRYRIAYSHNKGAKLPERLKFSNTGNGDHSYYVVIRPQGNSIFQDRVYTLRVGP